MAGISFPGKPSQVEQAKKRADSLTGLQAGKQAIERPGKPVRMILIATDRRNKCIEKIVAAVEAVESKGRDSEEDDDDDDDNSFLLPKNAAPCSSPKPR